MRNQNRKVEQLLAMSLAAGHAPYLQRGDVASPPRVKVVARSDEEKIARAKAKRERRAGFITLEEKPKFVHVCNRCKFSWECDTPTSTACRWGRCNGVTEVTPQ